MNLRILDRQAPTAPLVVLGGCLLWADWPVVGAMADRWSSDSRYAHGYLVPMFALALLWMRRGRLDGVEFRPRNWGLAPLGLGAAIRLVGGYYHVAWLEGLAILPYLAGIALLLGGSRCLAWAWPSIGFLGFMIPLPWRLETALGPLLQSIATAASSYILQTLGFLAFAEGNVIHLNEARLGVVEACSGLSMVMTFIALSTAAAIVVRRPLLDRFVLVASSIPVALLANIGRVVLTGILHETVGGHAAATFYHDLAGWVMIPAALVMYWVEIAILSRLLIETNQDAFPLLDLVRPRYPASTRAPRATRAYEPSIP